MPESGGWELERSKEPEYQFSAALIDKEDQGHDVRRHIAIMFDCIHTLLDASSGFLDGEDKRAIEDIGLWTGFMCEHGYVQSEHCTDCKPWDLGRDHGPHRWEWEQYAKGQRLTGPYPYSTREEEKFMNELKGLLP